MRIPNNPNVVIERHCRISFYPRMKEAQNRTDAGKSFEVTWRTAVMLIPTGRRQVVTMFWRFNMDKQNELGRYFRTLYHVFKLVKNSDFTPVERRRYTSIAR